MKRFLNRRMIMSAGIIVFVAAVAIGATGAFFSDTETSTGNTFTAGAIDLTVDSQQHYNNAVCVEGLWALEANEQPTVPQYPVIGTACGGTWSLTDLQNGVHKFFDFADIKPGDEGENTISLHIDSNDAYACVDVNITSNDDVDCTDPENDAEGVGICNTDGAPLFDGELAENLNFFSWADYGASPLVPNDTGEGDNIWQENEPALFSNGVGPASDALDGKTYALADSNTQPLPGGSTSYVGLAWCAGDMTAVAGVITCDGEGMGNEAQTDNLIADIAFRVEQARNNPDFICEPVDGEPEPELIGAALGAYTDPTSCDVTVTTTINAAIGVAAAGQTVCVPDGTFVEDVVVNKDITLAGSGATSTSEINGNVTITANGATVQGFEINGNVSATASGVTIQYNKVLPLAGGNGILIGGVSGGATSVIQHNVVTTFALTSPNNRGIYLDSIGASTFTVDHNTVTARKSGFGNGSSGSVTANVFNGYDDAPGVGWEVFHDPADVVPAISGNNFNESSGIGVANPGTLTFDAPDNWWGDASSAGNTSGLVTTSSDEAAAYPEN